MNDAFERDAASFEETSRRLCESSGCNARDACKVFSRMSFRHQDEIGEVAFVSFERTLKDAMRASTPASFLQAKSYVLAEIRKYQRSHKRWTVAIAVIAFCTGWWVCDYRQRHISLPGIHCTITCE